MLMPKRVKRRKQFRGSMRGKALRGNKITYGEYGIVATEPAWITANQIEAARVAMTRYIKRGGKVWIKIFPDKPVTAQPAETRMGKGKGNLEYLQLCFFSCQFTQPSIVKIYFLSLLFDSCTKLIFFVDYFLHIGNILLINWLSLIHQSVSLGKVFVFGNHFIVINRLRACQHAITAAIALPKIC